MQCADVVITGVAAISSAGVGIDPFVEALRKGTSFLTEVPAAISGVSGVLWGRAEGFKVTDYILPLKARKFDRCSQFAVVGAGMALANAGIDLASTDSRRVGIVIGCGFGGIVNSEGFLTGYYTGGVEGLAPVLFPNTVANAAASNAAIEHRLRGPNITVVQRFCSAESAFMVAARFIEEGRADIIITGGVDELSPIVMKGFNETGQLRHHANGFGEGAGFLVFESSRHAKARGASPVATVEGIRASGLILPGYEQACLSHLSGTKPYEVLSLSGTAQEEFFFSRQGEGKRIVDVAPIVGRSLAMGGLALCALVRLLPSGVRGLHLAASPEGPYFGLNISGGSADRS